MNGSLPSAGGGVGSGEGTRSGASTLAPERLDLPFADPLVRRLFPPLARGVHWGLERTRAALADLSDPHTAYPTVHVGGTNGKGSVVSLLSAALSAAGHRVAQYTSPHLCSFRERFQIRGRALPEETLVRRADEVRPAVERHGLTFFEAVTVLAFHAFAQEEIEVAVVEVGLGGRLDATNVIEPLATAVTNVAMDHADFLGESLEEIAREKAGIVKEGVPFATAETDPALLGLFRRVAARRRAPFHPVDPERVLEDVDIRSEGTRFRVRTRAWGELEVSTPLVGRHHAANAALAVEVLEHLPRALRPDADAVLRGLATVRHPGRDQIVRTRGRTWMLDVAHNTAGVLSLVDTLDRLDLPGPAIALLGVLGDKDWREMLPPLLALTEGAVLTQPPTAPPERRWDPRRAAEAVGHLAPLVVEDDFAAALELARERAGPAGTVVVTGSCHTVGAALSALGCAPLGD